MPRVLNLLLILGAAAIALTPLPRGVVERVYSRGVYPLIQPRLTALSNLTPFAWLDALALGIAGSILAMWIIRLRARRAGAWKTIGWLAADTGAAAAILYLWFLAAWGLNYQREPLRAQLDFQEDRITPEALRGLGARNVEALNHLYEEARVAGWPELHTLPEELGPAFQRTQQDLAMGWQAELAVPKRSLLNFYFTRVSIDGMTDPFFLETLANQSLLPFERASTIAHEWGHLAGYADESEASFFGWLVCMRGTPAVQYSGWLSLYGTVMSSLPRHDREEISRALGKGPRDDLRAIAERIRSQTMPTASRAGYAVYDRFLRANRVEAGIRSYGEVTRLLLGTRFHENGSPVLRSGSAR